MDRESQAEKEERERLEARQKAEAEWPEKQARMKAERKRILNEQILIGDRKTKHDACIETLGRCLLQPNAANDPAVADDCYEKNFICTNDIYEEIRKDIAQNAEKRPNHRESLDDWWEEYTTETLSRLQTDAAKRKRASYESQEKELKNALWNAKKTRFVIWENDKRQCEKDFARCKQEGKDESECKENKEQCMYDITKRKRDHFYGGQPRPGIESPGLSYYQQEVLRSTILELKKDKKFRNATYDQLAAHVLQEDYRTKQNPSGKIHKHYILGYLDD